MDALYRDEILEHYRHPHHAGTLAAPTHGAALDNPLCGDRISLQLRVEEGRVAEVAFLGRGCAISQAAASMLADELVGKELEKVGALGPDEAVALLGIEVSPARLKCATLAHSALRRALDVVPG